MSRPEFNEKELNIVSEFPDFFGNMIPVYNYPISMREAVVATYRDKDPWWILTDVETNTFTPSVIPDNGSPRLRIRRSALPSREIRRQGYVRRGMGLH